MQTAGRLKKGTRAFFAGVTPQMSVPLWQNRAMNPWNTLTLWIRSRSRTVLALLGMVPETKSEQLSLPLGETEGRSVPVRKAQARAGRRFSR